MARRNEKQIGTTYTACIETRTNARLERFRMGKRSAWGRLNQTIALALERLADDLEAGRITPPEWATPRARKPRKAAKAA